MRKADTVSNKKSKKVNAETYRCGDCLHWQRHAHSGKDGKVCANEGIRSFAVAPKCFTPDVSVLQGNTDSFLQLTMLVNSYTPKQRRIMLAVLRDASKVKKKGFTIGTKVYFKVNPGEYLNNYYFGFVMGKTSSNELMVQGSPDRKTRGDSFMFYVKDEEELLSEAEWKQLERTLKDEGKINDPNQKRGRIKRGDEEDYEPPSIDNCPASWWDRSEGNAGGKKLKTKRSKSSNEFQV